MKNSPLAAALAILLPLSAVCTAQDAAPKEKKDKVSYAIGLDIGSNLKRQGVEVNPAMLFNGLKDALSGTEPKLSEEDIRTTMQEFAGEMRTKLQEERAKASQENQAKGTAFLAENKKKEGWKELPSGLQYKVVREGKGAKPKASDTVSVHYRGTLIDGKEFDSSYQRNEPAEFPVDQVIPGWTEAMQLMPVGSKWQLAIPAKLAYGENAPGEIGPNSVLLFDVELLGIQKGDPAAESEGSAEPQKPAASPAKK